MSDGRRLWAGGLQTPVLTDDLRWIQAGDVVVGSGLLVCDEERTAAGRVGQRRWRRGHTSVVGTTKLLSMLITLSNGDRLMVGRHHPVMTHPHGLPGGRMGRWTDAWHLRVGDIVPKFIETWTAETSYDAGWLAGFLDGEGWAGMYTSGSVAVAANQLPGPVYERAVDIASRFGQWTFDRKRQGTSPTHSMRMLGKMPDKIRMLGRIRPIRLIHNCVEALIKGNKAFAVLHRPTVIAAECIGEQPVVVIGTSANTLIANGYAVRSASGVTG